MRSLRAVFGRSKTILRAALDVAVREHFDRRPAEPRAIDDAGVIQLIGDDEVVLREDGGDCSRIGGEAALKYDGGFCLFEVRKPPLQFHVDLHSSGNRAHRSGADAELLQRRESLLLQLWMRREAEVVVRGEIDDLAAVDSGARGLLVVQYAQAAVEALRLERVQFIAEKCEWVGAHVQGPAKAGHYVPSTYVLSG